MDKKSLSKQPVVFDLGNVILLFDSRKASRYVAEKAGCSEDDAHSFIFGTKLEKAIDRGKISLENFLARINEKFSSAISVDEFNHAWCDLFTLNAGIENIISGLKICNYRLGLLSNTNKPHFEYVKNKFPVLGLFDDYHLSFETGFLKPEKEAFENIINFYKCAPNELVFIDDLPANVQSARILGINAVCYKSLNQLTSDLTSLGLHFAI